MSSGAQPAKDLIDELRGYIQQFDLIAAEASEIATPLSEEQFYWQPAPGQWSIGECFLHLNAVDGSDLPSLEKAIAQGHRIGVFGHPPFRYGFLSRKFVESMEPPAKRRFKAPKAYLPPAQRPKIEVMNDFLSIHTRLKELVRESNGLDLKRIKTPTPVSRFVRFSLGQRFALLAAHDRRHLWQAREVRKHPDFLQSNNTA